MLLDYHFIRESFDSLAPKWFDPKNNFSGQSLFVLPEWLKTWWEVFSPDYELLLISVYKKNIFLGLAPFMNSKNRAEFIGDPQVFDYRDCIVRYGKEKEFFNVLLDYLPKIGIYELNLTSLRPESNIINSLVPIAESAGFSVLIKTEDICYEAVLPKSWEDYMAALKSKQRHEIRRKIRRLKEAGQLDFQVSCKSDNIEKNMETFFILFKESRYDKNFFMTEQMEEYFTRLAVTTARSGMLRLGILKLNQKIVAMTMGFDYAGRTYLYNNGYSTKFKSISVGIASKVFSIKTSLERGCKTFDFLKGREDYKCRLGGKKVKLSNCWIKLI